MSISYSQQVDLQCPSCHREFPAQAWIIVDADERPELAEALRDGRIHDTVCPHCGQPGSISAPLLYHDPRRRRVLFAVPPDMAEEEWRTEAQGLLWMLIGSLPEERRRPYLGEVQAEAGIDGLAFVLKQEHAEGAPSESAVEALSDSLIAGEGEPPVLAQAIMALLEAQTPAAVERVFDSYPFLLDQAMDRALHELAAAARNDGDSQSADAFERAAAILEQLRGVFAQTRAQAELEQQESRVDTQAAPQDEGVPAPPAAWRPLLAALLDPEQEASLEELQSRSPLLSDPHAPTWLRWEISRRREVGNLAEAQLLDEWLRLLKEG